jgi:Carbohydrate esterase, sialic acid-specific acetylesterase
MAGARLMGTFLGTFLGTQLGKDLGYDHASSADYDPSLDSALWWRVNGAVTDDGAGLATQVLDTKGTRHVTFALGLRPTIVAADATANNRRTYLFSGAQRGVPGGLAADWRKMHDATTQTFWVIFKPSSSATVDKESLFHDAAGFSEGNSGISICYDGARQSILVAKARGPLPIEHYQGAANGECLREAWHILVYQKNAAGFTVWLDGGRMFELEYGGMTPSTGNAISDPQLGGDPSFGHFRGHIAEWGITSSAPSMTAVTNYFRSYYGIATARTPNRRLNYRDGLNYAAFSPLPTVRTYFTKTTSTPGSTQVVGLCLGPTTLTAKARSGGEYELNVEIGTRHSAQLTWFTTVDGGRLGAGAVPAGKTRVIYLAMGESGMQGISVTTPLPSGYPPADGSVWTLNDEFEWVYPTEPLAAGGTYPVDSQFSGATGMGPAGQFAWRRQQALGSGYEVGILLCAKGGSTTTLWTTNYELRTSYAGGAAARLTRALMEPGTVFGGFLWDIGINDSKFAPPSVWTTNMNTLMAFLRAAVPATANAPVYYSRLFTAVPTDMAYPSWAAVTADQNAWESASVPKRIKVVDEPTDWDDSGHAHRGPLGNDQFAQAYEAAVAANP